MSEYRWAETPAAQMLASALRTASSERGVSLREIGRRLGYKQPVVLSHMATGRVPIPVDRAIDIAREVALPEKHFLEAVLEQRHPEIDWKIMTGKEDPLVDELETIAQRPLSALSADHQRVLRDLVRDPDPRSRWLSMPEISVVQMLRKTFPNMQRDGLSADERDLLDLLPALRDRT
jgi:hypothetical protein